MMFTKVGTFAVFSVFIIMVGASPSIAGLMEANVQSYVAPGNLFAVDVPTNWQVVLTDDPYTTKFVPQVPGDAMLWLRRIKVPRGAHPNQLALRALESRISKLPRYKLVNKRKVTVAGRRGASIIATFAFQNNIQYPRALEEVFVVVGDEAFIFHFECFEPFSGKFAKQLNRFYASFVPRPNTSEVFKAQTSNDVPFPKTDTMKY